MNYDAIVVNGDVLPADSEEAQIVKSEAAPILCIYHANCADGFSAAWAVWKRFGKHATYVPMTYTDTPPDVAGKHVIMVDFSFKLPVLLSLLEKNPASMLILDHHKSAAEDLAGLPVAVATWEDHMRDAATYADGNAANRVGVKFDMNKSGAVLAWEYFHPGKPVPVMLLHVQDRDLWRFKLYDTRALSAAYFSYPYQFDVWDALCWKSDDTVERFGLVREGAALERQKEKDIADLLPITKRMMTIGGYKVPVANLPYQMASDAAGQMASTGAPFAATYYDGRALRHFSLRSRNPGGIDVSEIAKKYGGGGHRNAAGFSVPLGWEGDPDWGSGEVP